MFREVKEELGVEIPNEQIKDKSICNRYEKNRRFAYNYIFVVDYKINDYTLQEEVAEVKYINIEDMEQAKQNNDSSYTFINWDKGNFERKMNLLKNKRKEIIGE